MLSAFAATANPQSFLLQRRRLIQRHVCPTPKPVQPTPQPQPKPVPSPGNGDKPEIDVDELLKRIIDVLANDPRFSVDYDRIQKMIDDSVESVAPVTPAPSEDVVHFTIIADEDASYWRRLGPLVSKAQERHHKIVLMDPPPDTAPPIGPLPQVVEYLNSIPQRTFFDREVYDVLDRVGRGTYPVTTQHL